MNYKEVLALAESKGYKPILCHMEKYGGSGKLPDDIISKARQVCELSLIQQWLREQNTRIWVFITPSGYQISSSYFATITGGKFLSYEQALEEAITEALKLTEQ